MAQEDEVKVVEVPTSGPRGCGYPTGCVCKRLEHHLEHTWGAHMYLPLVWSAWFTQPFPSSLVDFCRICQVWSFLFSELFLSSQSGMFSGHRFLGEKSSFLETVMGRQREGSEAPLINVSCCFLSCYYPPGYHMSWKTYNT